MEGLITMENVKMIGARPSLGFEYGETVVYFGEGSSLITISLTSEQRVSLIRELGEQ